MNTPTGPRCDMSATCPQPPTMLDQSGYIYCPEHGLQRRHSGRPCRKLTPAEIRRIRDGLPISRY